MAKVTKKKSTAKPKPKPTPKPTLKRNPKPKPKQKRKPAAEAAPPTRLSAPFILAGPTEHLGDITVPSGQLAIFDIGLFGFLPRPTLEPALIVTEVPADRPLRTVGVRVGTGRFADCWDHVAIVLGDAPIASAKKLGEAGVDFARLILIDHAALDHWQHDDSLDGRADFVFWGRDAAELARATIAPPSTEGYGWTNLTLAEAEARADQAARIKAEHRLLLATDLRPHSHHYYALAAARAAATQAGTLEVGGATACLFFTSWGDGVFPVYLDVDATNHPVQVRIQLATAASNRAMRTVNA